jgi:2-deoxy-D-gluconate 3-dehydrogenase
VSGILEMFDLTGHVAIVTGGNGGLGLAMARGLAEAGATIVVAARQREKAEQALQSLCELRPDCMFVELDVTSEEACHRTVDTVIERFGRVDILVNNAGVSVRKPPQELRDEEWQFVLDVNLSGAFHCCQAVYPHMKTQERGKIINIGSMYSIFAAPLVAAYAASKGGLLQMTKALACAWAPDHIQVNAILPGWLDTELTQTARKQVEGLNETVLARTPAGRWGVAGDIAGTAVFLASPASDFVTGAAIPVDGGYSARG